MPLTSCSPWCPYTPDTPTPPTRPLMLPHPCWPLSHLTLYTPYWPQCPLSPTPSSILNAPWCPYTLTPLHPCQPQMPWHPIHPCWSLHPNALHLCLPLCHLTPPAGPWPLHPMPSPNEPLMPLHPLPVPQHPLHPCQSPDTLHPLLTPDALWAPTPLLAPNTLHPCWPPMPLTPASPNTPYPQDRNLVVNSGSTAYEHEMSWACGSGCCFVRCTPTPQCPPGRGISWPRVVRNRPSCLLLLSLCNWPFSRVHPIYIKPSLDIKSMTSVLWSSPNFCNISQNIHSKVPVAFQYRKTNKVVWTWKYDWPPGELSLIDVG